MSDQIWLDITEISGDIGMILSLVGNSIVLMLLVNNPLTGIGSYRYIMATFAIYSLLYTAIETFIRPLMHHYDNTLWVIQRKRFNYSSSVSRALSATYCGFFAMSFVLFASHFIYRYFVACRPEKVKLFEGRNFIYWLLIILFVAGGWWAVAFFLFQEDQETMNSLNTFLESSYGLSYSQIGHVPYSFYHTVGTVRELRIGNCLGVVHHLIVMQIAIMTVFYYGYQTHSSILAIKGRSQLTRDLQQQFFTALVAQTTIPLLFMFIPNSVLSIAAFVNGNFGAWANVTVIMTHIYPGIDPFVLIFLIRGFRQTIKDFLCLRFTGKSSSPGSMQSSMMTKLDVKRSKSLSSVAQSVHTIG